MLFLDVGLPGKDGLGLESGADDYITQPFNARELLLSFGRWNFGISHRRLVNQDG